AVVVLSARGPSLHEPDAHFLGVSRRNDGTDPQVAFTTFGQAGIDITPALPEAQRNDHNRPTVKLDLRFNRGRSRGLFADSRIGVLKVDGLARQEVSAGLLVEIFGESNLPWMLTEHAFHSKLLSK